jgi:hypothetical protein
MSDHNPSANAAAAFPQAAQANRNVFYHRDGTAKTVREVHAWAVKQGGDAVGETAVPQKPAPAWSGAPVLPANNWPTTDLYDAVASLPAGTSQSFVLTPGIVSILASLTPEPKPSHIY